MENRKGNKVAKAIRGDRMRMDTATRRLFGINKKKRSYCLDFLALLSIPVLEIALDHYLFSGRPSALCDFLTFKGCWLYPLIFYPAVLLFLRRLVNRSIGKIKAIKSGESEESRLRDQLVPFLKSVVSLERIDLAATLLFLLHLTWIPDSIFDWVKETDLCYIGHPMIFIFGFSLVLFFVSGRKREDTSKQTVMFTGLSLLSLRTLIPFFRPLTKQFHDIRDIVVFVNSSMLDKDKGVIKIKGMDLLEHWKYLFGEDIADTMSLDERNKEIQKRREGLGFSMGDLECCKVSHDTLSIINGFAEKGRRDKLASLKQFLEAICKRILNNNNVVVELVECSYSADINILTSLIQEEIKKRREKHEDGTMLFNLTPGMLSISVPLAFNATRGTRISCYIDQETGELRIYNLENRQTDD
jgi:hypothetical protein